MLKRLIGVVTLLSLCVQPSLGGVPTVHVTWNQAGSPPILGTDYLIDPSVPAYPNVELITGSLNWRIWSTDPNVEGGVGDIGVISCPHAQNFGIKILTPSGGQGAREVVGMNLQPTSVSNYSRIVDGNFSALTGFLYLQKSEDGAGGNIGSLHVETVGFGNVLLIPGGVTGNVTIDAMSDYSAVVLGADTVSAMLTIAEIGENALLAVEKISGQVNIGAMYSGAEVTISKLAFSSALDVGDMVDGSSLFLNTIAHNEYTVGATAHIGGMHGSSLVSVGCPCGVEEEACPCRDSIPVLAVTIDSMDGQSTVRYHYGPGNASRLEIGEMTGSNRIESGKLASGGTISLSEGIPVNCTVELTTMSSGSLVDLNDGPVNGTFKVLSSCDGAIANGGEVTGAVDIPGNASVATFGKVAPGGQITTGPSATGVIIVLSDLDGIIRAPLGLWGTIRVDGFIGITGLIEVDLNLAGLVQVGQHVATGGAVTVDGNIIGSGNVNIIGMNHGLIHVGGTMDTQSLIKVSGGLNAGSLIDVNTSGASNSTTAGTIWIGGSATQNPLPPVTMLGTVRVNCPELTKTFAGQVKVVGCASATHQSADICVYGTIPPGNRPILYVDKNCTHKYGTSCTTGCGS